jgi:hypothetical protein
MWKGRQMNETERAKKEAELLGQGWHFSVEFVGQEERPEWFELMNRDFTIEPELGGEEMLCWEKNKYARPIQIDKEGWITLPQGTVTKPAWVTGMYRMRNDQERGILCLGCRRQSRDNRL